MNPAWPPLDRAAYRRRALLRLITVYYVNVAA